MSPRQLSSAKAFRTTLEERLKTHARKEGVDWAARGISATQVLSLGSPPATDPMRMTGDAVRGCLFFFGLLGGAGWN